MIEVARAEAASSDDFGSPNDRGRGAGNPCLLPRRLDDLALSSGEVQDRRPIDVLRVWQPRERPTRFQ